MPLRTVLTSNTFEQQRQTINLIGSDLDTLATGFNSSVLAALVAGNTNVDISTSNDGVISIFSANEGSIDGMKIGATVKSSGAFVTLQVRDTTTTTRDLFFASNSSVALSANRTVEFDVINANRIIKLGGNINIANNLTTSGNFALTLTTTAATTATLPAGTVTLVSTASPNFTSNVTASTFGVELSGSLAAVGSEQNRGLLKIGTLGFNDSNLFANYQTSINNYAQIVVQNTNAGTTASSDVVVHGDGATSTTRYGDFGINSTGFTGGGAFGDAGGTYLYSVSGTLAVGTNDSFALKLFANATTNTTAGITINTDNTVAFAGGSLKTGAAVNSSLFGDTTTGTITIGGALTTGTFTIGATGSTGAVSLFPATGSQAITLGGATTGAIQIGSTLASSVTLPTGKTKIGNTTLAQGGSVTITLPTLAGTLVGSGDSTLPSSITSSSLTSVGTLTALTVTGTGTNTISLTTGTTGALTLDSGTTGSISIGTNANAKAISFGNNTVASTITFNNNPASGTLSDTTATTTTVDSSTVCYYSKIATLTAAITINVSNLTSGRMITMYLRNTGVGAFVVTIAASTTASGFANVNLAPGAGATSVTSVSLAATTGTAVVRVFNAGGSIGGSIQ
jgi:hypothetical protein